METVNDNVLIIFGVIDYDDRLRITIFPNSQAPQAAPQQYMRPEMPVPPQPQPQGNPADFWNSFGNLADRDPANAWRYLNAAQQNPEVFRSKMLVME